VIAITTFASCPTPDPNLSGAEVNAVRRAEVMPFVRREMQIAFFFVRPTRVDDLPFYSPHKRPASPRRPQLGEHLWTFIRGTERRRAELRDFGKAGVELQMYVNDEFVSGQRFANRELAVPAAAAVRETYEHDEWKRA
jgi:hypothetical protein